MTARWRVLFRHRFDAELWQGTVHKALEVWYFPDCEVVHYQASTPARTVRPTRRGLRCSLGALSPRARLRKHGRTAVSMSINKDLVAASADERRQWRTVDKTLGKIWS